MIGELRPTSKASMKQICLLAADGDLDKASKLYDYMIKGMEDLPMFDIPRPSTIEQVKNGISDTWQWFTQNEDQVMGIVDMIKGVMNKGGGNGGVPTATTAATQAIPSINQ